MIGRQAMRNSRQQRDGMLLALFTVGVFAAYVSNGKSDETGDVRPGTYLPLAILSGDGLHLEHVAPQLDETIAVATWRGHLVSRYPVAPALAAVPVTAAQIALLTIVYPEWSSDESIRFPELFAKNTHALFVAATAGLLLSICLDLCSSRGVAILAALAAALGSSFWSVASQAAWQHGLAALSLTAAIYALIDERVSRKRLLAAGLGCAVLVASRHLDIVYAIAFASWVLYRHRRSAGWFFPGPVLIGAALIAYNYYYFGTLEGGQSQVEAYHPKLHDVSGIWTGNLIEGALGTLVSPSRGLLVYCPWIAFALLFVSRSGLRRLPSVVSWLLIGLLANGLLLAKYSVWWGGWSFGPRYWTDSIPILTILFAVVLDETARRKRAATALAGGLVAASVAIHAIGAYGYPSTWCATPIDVDRAHERLWDWRDNELIRIVREGARAPTLWGLKGE